MSFLKAALVILLAWSFLPSDAQQAHHTGSKARATTSGKNQKPKVKKKQQPKKTTRRKRPLQDRRGDLTASFVPVVITPDPPPARFRGAHLYYEFTIRRGDAPIVQTFKIALKPAVDPGSRVLVDPTRITEPGEKYDHDSNSPMAASALDIKIGTVSVNANGDTATFAVTMYPQVFPDPTASSYDVFFVLNATTSPGGKSGAVLVKLTTKR